MRVRFAPSPTGALHIGGARTALFNWLLARGAGGRFVLRIEDTDRERSTPENVEQILDALRWLELDWDEGPIIQSEREERHRDAVTALLDSRARLPLARDRRGREGVEGATRRRPRLPRHPEGDGAVRLRVPDEGETAFTDLVLGEVAAPNRSLDDLVIARADGTPLYNLAVAVDDLDVEITHVVRGNDHLTNTAKQLLVIDALGAERSALRPPPAAARPRRQEALQAPRRRLRAGAARRRLPARRGAQLPRAARLGHRATTRRSSRPTSSSRASTSRACSATRRSSTSASCAGSTVATCAS